jgi:hypothetical protein
MARRRASTSIGDGRHAWDGPARSWVWVESPDCSEQTTCGRGLPPWGVMFNSHTHPESTVDYGSAGCTRSQFCFRSQSVAQPHAKTHTEAVQRPACRIRVFLAATSGFLVVAAV